MRGHVGVVRIVVRNALELDDATHAHGLATTGGIVSSTGIGGLTSVEAWGTWPAAAT